MVKMMRQKKNKTESLNINWSRFSIQKTVDLEAVVCKSGFLLWVSLRHLDCKYQGRKMGIDSFQQTGSTCDPRPGVDSRPIMMVWKA